MQHFFSYVVRYPHNSSVPGTWYILLHVGAGRSRFTAVLVYCGGRTKAGPGLHECVSRTKVG